MTTDCESYGMFVTPKEYKFLEEMTKRHEVLEEEIAIAQKEVEIATAQGKLAMVTFKPGMDGEMHPSSSNYGSKAKEGNEKYIIYVLAFHVYVGYDHCSLYSYFLGMCLRSFV